MSTEEIVGALTQSQLSMSYLSRHTFRVVGATGDKLAASSSPL